MKDIFEATGFTHIPVLTGPTASGKSALAMELCRKSGGELICCDSMQIYKGMDIGTAKDSREEMIEVPHHMTDIVEPGTDYSVNDYVTEVLKVIPEILKKGKLPVLCGGTGQYVKALYTGMDLSDHRVSDELIDELTREYEEKGIDSLYERLEKADPEAAAKIHKNNTRRVIRALAVCMTFDKNFTQMSREAVKGAEYPFKLFQIDWDRSILYDRINKRVDVMIEEGLVDEVRRLYDSGVNTKSTCFQAIGYKEFAMYLKGDISLEDAVYEIKLRSRHYAKRQLTWFRYMEGINMLKPESMEEMLDKILLQIR